jgi:hypothetical protein
MGTIVRFTVDTGNDLEFTNPLVPPKRCWVRVSGADVGQMPLPGVVGQWYDAITTAHRDAPWDALEDIMERPELLDSLGVFGTNALADFQSACPSTSLFYKLGMCAIPLVVNREMPTAREVFGGIMAALPADLCYRWDDAAGEKRLFPLWRPLYGTPADWTFRRHDLSSADPPSIKLNDDPDGVFGTRFAVESPEYWISPLMDPDWTIEVSAQRAAYAIVAAEDGPSGLFGGSREMAIKWDHWMHAGESGFDEAVKFLVAERGQRQRVIEATLGVRGFAVQLGDSVAYEIPGVWRDKGQVRAMRYDLDMMRVRVKTYHNDFYLGGDVGEQSRQGE